MDFVHYDIKKEKSSGPDAKNVPVFRASSSLKHDTLALLSQALSYRKNGTESPLCARVVTGVG